MPSGSALQSPPAASKLSSPRVKPVPAYPIYLPLSSGGATTCTVYEDDYGTQIVVDSQTLDVRAQCLVWAANRLDAGYLWSYKPTAVLPAGIRICSLTDPHRKLTASVVDTAAFVPGSAAERARGVAFCASILAAGWRPVSRVRSARS